MYNGNENFDIDLRLSSCTLDNNTADGNGGAIQSDDTASYSGKILMNDCVVSYNTATGDNGGAIYWTNDGEVRINRSSFYENNSGNNGGAIYNSDVMSITQCTISGNTATGGNGGGIDNHGSLELMHTTIAGNTASHYGGGICSNGVNFHIMEHTILENNTASDDGPDFFSMNQPIGSEQYNLIGDNTGCTTIFISGTDILNQDPLLDPLANNGGPTLTHALQGTSPAIDVGDPSFSNPLLPNDQRTSPFLRVIDGRIDIGAYESGNIDPIPTLNEWGMIMLVLLISGSAVWSLRRKKIEL